MRLVVDTGLHAKGWTREQAIQYMLDNSTLAEATSSPRSSATSRGRARRSATRSVTCASRRCAREAEAELGEKFDVRDFHREVLGDGAVPMDVLEAKIERWIVRGRMRGRA